MNKEIKLYFKGLDGLRAYSIILVLITHLGLFMSVKNPFLVSLFSGTTGVNIFFTISGFLITTLLLNEKSTKNTISVKKFYIRRFLRLLPVLVLFLVVLAILKYFELLKFSGISFFAALSYLTNYLPWRYYSQEMGHLWSLGVEEQFYLFCPFFILLFKKKTWLIVGVFLIIISIQFYYFFQYFDFYFIGYKINIKDMFPDGGNRFFLPASLPIMIGCLTAIYLKYNSKQYNYRVYPLLSILFYILGGYSLNLNILNNILFGISTSLMIIFLIKNSDNKFVNFLEFKPIKYIGKISYGIYIWQGLFLRTGPGGELWIQKFPQNIILTFLVSILSYEYFEKFFLQLKNKFN